MHDLYIADSPKNRLIMSDTRLQIEIKNIQPVELLDYTESLFSLGTLYNKYMANHPELTWDYDSRLYINEIKKGSIVTVLQDLIPVVIPFADYADKFNNIVEFTKYVKSVLYSVINKKDEETGIVPSTPLTDIQDLKNFNNFINPIAKDRSSQLNAGAINISGNVIINFNLSSLEANAAQNKIKNLIGEMQEPIQSSYKKEIFIWHIAKNDVKSQSGDKGIIEKISKKPCKVIFANEKIKSEMIDIDENPLHKAFVVDVDVSTIQLKPIAYKITKMYEYFDY